MSFNNDFDVESYVKVNTRLIEFWTKYPEGRIETSVAWYAGDYVLEARLYRDQKDTLPAATGHSFLEGLGGDKVGEYTETVAVGRALALMGFQVEKSIASSEEMGRFKKRQDSKEKDPRISKIKTIGSSGTNNTSAITNSTDTKQISDIPEVPRTLKPSRVFKPLQKSE